MIHTHDALQHGWVIWCSPVIFLNDLWSYFHKKVLSPSLPSLFLFHIRFYFLPEHNHRVLPLLQQDVISLHLTSPSTMGVPVPGPLFHSTLCYNHSHIELFPLPPSRRIHLEGRDCIVVSPARPKTQLGMLKALSKYFSCWIKDCIVDKYPLIYFILI